MTRLPPGQRFPQDRDLSAVVRPVFDHAAHHRLDGVLPSRHVAAEIGRVDILFNCAGFVHNGTVLDCTDRELDFAYDLNVKAMIRSVLIPMSLAASRL